VIPHGFTGTAVSLPAHLDRSVVVVTGSTLVDQRMAYRLEQECGARLRAWLMLAERSPDVSTGTASAVGPRRWGRLRRHLTLGPRHLIRLAGALPRRLQAQRAMRGHPRALARAEQRLLAEDVETFRRGSRLSPQRLGDPALHAALQAYGPDLVVAASPGLIPSEVARTWTGPLLTVYPGWSPAVRGEAPVEQALFRRDLQQLGATVHLLTGTGELGPMLRRSHPCLVPWDSPSSCRLRVLTLGTELLAEAVREFLDRGEVVAYDSPAGAEASVPPAIDGRLLAMLEADHRHEWLAAALHDARRF
jgi:folate-dependent phosphoribosylglycinamide formyltransferase PurN